MDEYKKKLEEFRYLYFTKYGVKMDDEILYFFIRINEMQVDLKKDIKNIPKVTFKNRIDYFYHGLGQFLLPSFISTSLLIIFFTIFKPPIAELKSSPTIVVRNKIPYVQLKINDSLFYLPVIKSSSLK